MSCKNLECFGVKLVQKYLPLPRWKERKISFHSKISFWILFDCRRMFADNFSMLSSSFGGRIEEFVDWSAYLLRWGNGVLLVQRQNSFLPKKFVELYPPLHFVENFPSKIKIIRGEEQICIWKCWFFSVRSSIWTHFQECLISFTICRR